MINEKRCPRVAVTPGEPAGVGPDIVIQAAQQSFNAAIIAIADPDLLRQRAAQLNLPLELKVFNPDEPAIPYQSGKLEILPVQQKITIHPGRPDSANASYVLETLRIACQGCIQHSFDAMVTAPVHKAIINQAGFHFSGHTEFLAGICGVKYPVMMLANAKFRVALVTTHLPLSEVSQAITREKLEHVLKVVWHDLHERFSINIPHLLVCGLNPHAGEDGYLGQEEKQIIMPVLEKLRRSGMRLTGPVPADTAFTPDQLHGIDIVISMYHDQGLPVLKAQGFGETVNITLGLPIIRTSVDHGTALSLAGTGKANCSSLLAAINCAIDLAISHSAPALSISPASFKSAQIVL